MLNIGITTKEFKRLADIIYAQFGIHLNEQKIKLVEGRLQKILKQYNMQSFAEYAEMLEKNGKKNPQLFSELADRISTNHTYFYREPIHFDLFEKKILPELQRHNNSSKKLRVWCAAASTGEEPYLLAILLRKYFGPEYLKWDAGVLATDISNRALTIMKEAKYAEDGLQLLPKGYLTSGFDKVDRDNWVIKQEIRKDVTIRRFNLMNPFPFKSKWDVIFCRNVMIYFDEQTKVDLVNRMYQSMNPGGHFFISLSESIDRKKCPFKYISPGYYRKL